MADDSHCLPVPTVEKNNPDMKAPGGHKSKPGTKTRESRIVSKLSEERLAKKRAADRHAQRVLRQKTQKHIESLEQKIEELSNKPGKSSALLAAKKRNQELEDELKRMRSAVLDKGKGRSSFSEGLAHAGGEPTVFRSRNANSSIYVPSGSLRACDEQSSDPLSSSPREDEDEDEAEFSMFNAKASLVAAPTTTLNLHTSQYSRQSLPASKPYPNENKIRDTQLALYSRSPKNVRIVPLARPGYVLPATLIQQPSVQIWELPLRVAEPKSPIDHILSGIITQQKSVALTSTSQSHATGPRYPNLNVLLAPQHSDLVHPVARALTDLLHRITYRTFVEKLAILLVIYPIYQWQISNSYEDYLAIPSWSRPIPSQRTIPHPIWICGMGWPKLREKCIQNQEKYCTEEFQYMVIQSVNVHWPHGVQAALRRVKGGFTVTKEFWDHTRIMDNWSLDEPFQSRYPELEHCCKFTKY